MSNDAADEVPAKKGGSKVVMAVVVLNLGITGFIGFRLTRPTKDAHATEAKAAAAAGGSLVKPNDSLIEVFDPFVVNLNEDESTRYLKLTFELEMVNATALADLRKMRRVVRDELLRYLSSLTVKDTVNESNKNKIADAIVERAHKVIGTARVKRLYFSEFVVQ